MNFFKLILLFISISFFISSPSYGTNLEQLIHDGFISFRSLAPKEELQDYLIFNYLNIDDSYVTVRIVDKYGKDKLFKKIPIKKKKFLKFLKRKSFTINGVGISLNTSPPVFLKDAKNGKGHFSSTIHVKTNKFDTSFKAFLVINIASFNTLNLWDNNPTNTKEGQLFIYDSYRPEFSNWYDKKIYAGKLQSFYDTIKFMKYPEIIALQEIESADNKNELFEKGSSFIKKLKTFGYNYFILGKQEQDNPTGITTAFISKYKITKMPSVKFNVTQNVFKNFNKKRKKQASWTTRDIQVVKLDIFNNETILYNNHWRSQGCSSYSSCEFSKQVRYANAAILKKNIKKSLKQDPLMDIVIIGDLNSEYWQNPLKILGTTGNEQQMQKENTSANFYNLWFELKELERFEATFSGKYHTLSHILINSNLYNNHSLQYVDNSFRVIGSPVKDPSHPLTNADGNPFRWQMSKHIPKYLEKSINNKIKSIVKTRKCKNKGKRNKRCNPLYFKYRGIGYSDHFPIIASFFPQAETSKVAKTKFDPSSKSDDFKKPKYLDAIVFECPDFKKNKDKFLNVETIDFNKFNYFKKCVYYKNDSGAPFETIGLYKSNYIKIKNRKLGVSLTRSFDPRPIKNGKPIHEVKHMDNKSNMCFTRKVLQGKGGKLNLIYGRLGYSNGIVTIFASRRNHLKLSNLPFKKKISCKNSIDDL